MGFVLGICMHGSAIISNSCPLEERELFGRVV